MQNLGCIKDNTLPKSKKVKDLYEGMFTVLIVRKAKRQNLSWITNLQVRLFRQRVSCNFAFKLKVRSKVCK